MAHLPQDELPSEFDVVVDGTGEWSRECFVCVDYLPRPTQDWYRVYWPPLSLELGNQCYTSTGEETFFPMEGI